MAATTVKRTYGQYCALAYGMDVIGERWTMVLIRELLLGPKRYKDLLAAMPGIGTNLLADRLRQLEQLDVVEKSVLPPPAGSSVYQLTAVGQGLEPIVFAIARWGSRFLGPRRRTDELSAGAYFIAMRGVFRSEEAHGPAQTYEFRVDGRVFEVQVLDGRCTATEGTAAHPDVIYTMDTETLNDLMFRVAAPAALVLSGRIAVEGDPKSLDRFIRVFGLGFRPTAPVKKAKPARRSRA